MISEEPRSLVISTRLRRVAGALCFITMAIVGCSKDEPTVSKEQLLSRANEAFAAERFVEAEKGYREVLRVQPDNSDAQRQLGIIYFTQGQVRQAFPFLKKSLELQPDNVDVQLKLALIYNAGRDFQKARDLARQILEKNPADQEALLLMVYTADTPAALQETRNIVDKLKGQADDQATYHFALGAIELRQKDDTRAEAEFKAALDLAPKSAAIHAALGNFYLSKQDLTAATQAYKTATTLSPPRSPIRVRYADLLLRTGAAAEAKKLVEDDARNAPDYLPNQVFLMKIACAEKRDDDCAARVEKILAQDSFNYDALFESGISSLSKGDATRAIRIFEQLSGMTQDARPRFQLALAYLLYAKGATEAEAQKAVVSAVNRLTEAVNVAPQFDQPIMLLAEIKIRTGNAAAAVDLLLPLIKEQPQIARAHYLLATTYLARRQTDRALAVYRKMVELFPKDPQPSFLVGALLVASGQQPEARAAFEKSIEISADYLLPVEALVNLDIADKQYATALDRVQQRIDKDPKSVQAWALRGRIYLAQKDFTRAEADLLKAIDLDAGFEPAYLLLAQLYVASNRQQQAIDKLTAFVKDRKDPRAFMSIALIQESLGHFAEARDAYEKVLAGAPNFVLALNNLAAVYSDHLPGQMDKAYELAKKGRDAAPDEPHIADTLGWILFKKGEYRNALPLLQESALKLSQANVQYHLGMAYYMLGEEASAREALQKAVDDAKLDSVESDEARKRLALLAIDPRTAESAARENLQKLLQERPNDPLALLRLAQLQERDGAVEQAIKTYQKIVDLNPLFAPALKRLVILASQRSPDDPKTFEITTKARDAQPDDPEIAKALGILNYRRGYYQQSAELLKKLAANQKDDSEILYYLGQAYRQLKQWDECKETLARTASLNVPPKLAEEAKSALADCSDPRHLALLYSQRSPDDPKTFELVTTAHNTYPDDPEIAKTLGILNYRRGDYQQSAALLKEASEKRKDDPELLYYLGQAYRQLKQRDDCKGTLTRALNFNLSPALADDAKRALADCSAPS